MMFGMGCDLCAVARIEKSLNRAGGAFARRVYGEAERAALGLTETGGAALAHTDASATAPAQAGEEQTAQNGAGTAPARYCAHTVESAAANFAAKEAFLKAAGTGLAGFAMEEIEALRQPSGAPYYVFSGRAAAWMNQNRLTAQLSLSHESGMALAVCILEKID